jgi:hypothetical protein
VTGNECLDLWFGWDCKENTHHEKAAHTETTGMSGAWDCVLREVKNKKRAKAKGKKKCHTKTRVGKAGPTSK